MAILPLRKAATPPPPPPSPPEMLADAVRPQLADAERVLTALQDQVAEAALDRALAKSGAAARLTTLNHQITSAERDVAQLRAALEIAEQRDAATVRAGRHVRRLNSLKDFETVVHARNTAGKKLGETLAQASAAYRAFVETQQSLPAILPLDVTLNESERMTLNELTPDLLVAGELYRLGAVLNRQGTAVTGFALPGARPAGVAGINNPAAIPALVDRVEGSTAWILNWARERVAALE
jgi:hypothetical protein